MKQQGIIPLHAYSYEQTLNIKEEKQMILAKIKYISSHTQYVILDKNDFDSLLGYLSENSLQQVCEQQIKQWIWKKCPKQARGGVQLSKLAQSVAEMICDPQTSKERKLALIDIFVNFQKKLLFYTSKNCINLHNVSILQRIDETDLDWSSTSNVSPLHSLHNPQAGSPPLRIGFLTPGLPSNRLHDAFGQSNIQGTVSIFRRAMLVVNSFLKGLFFQKNHLEKTYKFSLRLTFATLLQTLQIVGLIWTVYVLFIKQKKHKPKRKQMIY